MHGKAFLIRGDDQDTLIYALRMENYGIWMRNQICQKEEDTTNVHASCIDINTHTRIIEHHAYIFKCPTYKNLKLMAHAHCPSFRTHIRDKT